jgi:hypothetical protein
LSSNKLAKFNCQQQVIPVNVKINAKVNDKAVYLGNYNKGGNQLNPGRLSEKVEFELCLPSWSPKKKRN